MNRRNFIINSTGLIISLPAWARKTDLPYLKKIGIQLYTLRKPISQNLENTLRLVSEAGYKQVEPYGFPSPKSVLMIKEARKLGMEVHSTHFDWNSILHPERKGVPEFKKIIALAYEHGLSHLVVPYLAEEDRKSLDGYKTVAEKINKASEVTAEAGIQLAYHNHAFEFKPYQEKQTGYEIFIQNFSKNVAFEMDVFWVKLGGADPVSMIKELKGRVSQLHLKDLKKKSKIPNFGIVSPDTFDEIGDGMIDMIPIMKIAKKTGVHHCHIEQDQSPDPLASIQKSLSFLQSK